MGTIVRLDVERPELIEPAYSRSRNIRSLALPQDGRNLLWQWQTGTYTLMPVNLTPDFNQTEKWEGLKYRLADVVYDPDWWTEVPYLQLPGKGNFDYFFHGKVKKDHVPDISVGGGNGGAPPAPGVGSLLTIFDPGQGTSTGGFPEPLITAAILTILAQMQQNSVGVFTSKTVQPANQGYCLRFWVEGRPEWSVGDLLTFYFSDYALRLNGDGLAELWQALDASLAEYRMVAGFRWAEPTEVHQRPHRLLIVPHDRNRIEFLTRYPRYSRNHLLMSVFQQVKHESIYTVPGDLVFDESGTPIVTVPGYWMLAVSRRMRPYIQVSRVGYNNGAGLYDDAQPLLGGATLPFWAQPDGDLNGGTIENMLFDGLTGTPFALPPPALKSIQYGIYLRGKGDIAASGDVGSSTSPELYGYALHKPAVFLTVPRTETRVRLLDIAPDFGSSPEEERATIRVSNTRGQVDAFRRRSDVPLIVEDDETGVVFFEGTATEIVSSESPSQSPPDLKIEAAGMADNLLRTEWTADSPDFGKDPYDQAGRGWRPGDIIRHVFMCGGFDPQTQVVIEEEDVWFAPGTDREFRIWLEGDAGGTRGASGKIGASDSVAGSRWKPHETSAVYEWQSWFIKDILGWNFYWDRQNHLWRVYKRPRPDVALDLPKFAPKAAFYNNRMQATAAPDGLPSHPHSDFETRSSRPLCSTLIGFTFLSEEASVPVAFAAPNGGSGGLLQITNQADSSPADAPRQSKTRRIPCTLTNRKAYYPADPTNNPDYLGRNRFRQAPLVQATSREALEWMTRNLYYDICFGRLWGQFISWWGDPYTAYLRKWDTILIDSGEGGVMEKWLIDRIEPQWSQDKVRRARYTVSLFREDVPPPR